MRVVLAVLPLGEVGHLRLARVLFVIRRAHEVRRHRQPHERANGDARDDGGTALLAAIGVHSLRVARIEERVALDERLRGGLLGGGMRGFVAAVVRERAVVIHRREALPDLGGALATRVEALELRDPLLGLPVLGATDAAALRAHVGVRRVQGRRVDGGSHGLSVRRTLHLRAPVFFQVPTVLVVVVAILRAVAGAADDIREGVREVSHHPDAKGEHGDGNEDEAHARLATRGEDLVVGQDHDFHMLLRFLIVPLLLLVVEEFVLRLLPQLGLERVEHRVGTAVYPARYLAAVLQGVAQRLRAENAITVSPRAVFMGINVFARFGTGEQSDNFVIHVSSQQEGFLSRKRDQQR